MLVSDVRDYHVAYIDPDLAFALSKVYNSYDEALPLIDYELER